MNEGAWSLMSSTVIRRVAVALLPLPFLSAATTYNWNSKVRKTLAVGRKERINKGMQALQFRHDCVQRRDLTNDSGGGAKWTMGVWNFNLRRSQARTRQAV